jgi:hypothetical protein
VARLDIPAFIKQLLARADWQILLCGQGDDLSFAKKATALARAADAEISTEEIMDALTRPQFQVELLEWPPVGWSPVGKMSGAGPTMIKWAWFGKEPIDTPFFDDAFRAVKSRPINRIACIVTSLDTLVAGASEVVPMPLAGLIFHMSRCGSTLLGRMLSVPAHHLLLSEPEPLDVAISLASQPGMRWDDAIVLLRAMVAAMARPCGPGGQMLFLKCDAWHIRHLPLFRSAFPETPWLYLFRNPSEVVVSHLREPGRHVVPGQISLPMVPPKEMDGLNRENRIALSIAPLGASAIQHRPLGAGLFVDYARLLKDGFSMIERHFQLAFSQKDRAAIAAVSQFNAKNPRIAFSSDSAEKRKGANAEILSAVAMYLDPVHQKLLALSDADAR